MKRHCCHMTISGPRGFGSGSGCHALELTGTVSLSCTDSGGTVIVLSLELTWEQSTNSDHSVTQKIWRRLTLGLRRLVTVLFQNRIHICYKHNLNFIICDKSSLFHLHEEQLA
jgi:hypothetical protein